MKKNKINNKKSVHYDSQSDVLYLGAKGGIEEEFIEISPGVNVELDRDGQVLGVEIINASRVLKSVFGPARKRILEKAMIQSG